MNPLLVYFAVALMILTSRAINDPSVEPFSREMWIAIGGNGIAFLLLVLARQWRDKRDA